MEIIAAQRIATQEELCDELQKRGFSVTQATVSRDIRELKLIKIADDQGYRYAVPDAAIPRSSQERMRRLFMDAVLSIDASENLIVVKTLPGSANAVASALDTSGIQEILGTVAGDDTILVVVKPKQVVSGLLSRLRELIE